jgi:regulator of RNase E activity RraA
VLVVDALGRADGAAIGDILATRMRVRGVAGLVSDACVRDADGVRASQLPVWCPGAAAPASVASLSDGDLNVPIGCGGVAVIPGDWVVCDNDGVVVIPLALVQEVAEGGLEQELHEQFILQQVQHGATIPGTYPPNAENLAKYQAWKAQKGG